MDSQVEQVKQAIDIVVLVGERVKLTKAGKNYKGLCPFHSEKSPSFFVTPELGRYKCFGCQESGDVFTFLMKMDALTFGQALSDLAKRAGIALTNIPRTGEEKKKERLFGLLSLAKEYYHFLLLSHAVGKQALEYVRKRGITQSTIENFSLGYAGESWDALQQYLCKKKGYTQQELLDAGLVVKNDRGRIYDRFRGRIMFPLLSHRGQVVGFSGRLLVSDAKEAKYINTPETALYHKSELLFGYTQAASLIRKSNEVLICEGEFDVLSSMQAHVGNVVAIKGSALTAAHVKFLSHTVSKIILALDADAAGITATKRAIAVVRESGADVLLRVVPLTGGKDPDDIAKNDPNGWRAMVASSVSVYEYLISVAFAKQDSSTGEGKRLITSELAPILSGIDHAVERAHYVSFVAQKLGCSEDALLAEMRKSVLPEYVRAQTGKKTKTDTPVLDRREVLSRYIVLFAFAVLVQKPEDFLSTVDRIHASCHFLAPYQALFDALYAQRLSQDVRSVLDSLGKEYEEMVTTLSIQAGEFSDALLTAQELDQSIEELTQFAHREEQSTLIARLSQLEQQQALSEQERAEMESIRHLLVKH